MMIISCYIENQKKFYRTLKAIPLMEELSMEMLKLMGKLQLSKKPLLITL
jgi:hypothetical protein